MCRFCRGMAGCRGECGSRWDGFGGRECCACRGSAARWSREGTGPGAAGLGTHPCPPPLRLERRLLKELEKHALLAERVKRLQTIQGVGPVLALTWVLEVGEHSRFSSIGDAVSYCGLCGAQKESAEKSQRGPLSKQRNKHLQTMLIEAAKLAPR